MRLRDRTCLHHIACAMLYSTLPVVLPCTNHRNRYIGTHTQKQVNKEAQALWSRFELLWAHTCLQSDTEFKQKQAWSFGLHTIGMRPCLFIPPYSKMVSIYAREWTISCEIIDLSPWVTTGTDVRYCSRCRRLVAEGTSSRLSLTSTSPCTVPLGNRYSLTVWVGQCWRHLNPKTTLKVGTCRYFLVADSFRKFWLHGRCTAQSRAVVWMTGNPKASSESSLKFLEQGRTSSLNMLEECVRKSFTK